jgi:hypothetical protein
MDNAKLRGELDKLATRALELHRDAKEMEAADCPAASLMQLGNSKGILEAVAKIGLLFDPPLEVVSQGPRYVVREKRAREAESFFTEAQV